MMSVRSIVSVTLVAMAASAAIAQNGSPCNEGRDPVHEPRNPYAICLPEIGRMDAYLSPCHITGYDEQFGNQLAAVGDVDHSGTVDFVVGHQLCSYRSLYFAEELLLYKGVRGGIPASVDGRRIGPVDSNSVTQFVAVGDWDGDSHKDIAVRVRILGDTSESNYTDYETSRLVVFWGNESGDYSLLDTSHLSSDANMWLGINHGVGADLDNDGVDDLLVPNSSGFSNGEVVPIARCHLFKGRKGRRWGRDGMSRVADWRWWNGYYITPELIDHDGDKNIDIVWNGNDGDESFISILYRDSKKALPDTSSIQTVFVGKVGAAAGWSLLSDVTGDSIPEILANSIVTTEIKVYIGFKGQRLLEQFGSGNDSAQSGEEKWWGKPWARLWTPHRINSNWFGDVRLFDLGDANRDGIGDIFAFSWPYVMEYNGGEKMDSLADALINITPGTGIGMLKRLGNIDGSGRDIIALTTGNEIRFYVPTKDISSFGFSRRLPPGAGKATVEDSPGAEDNPSLILTAIPNPTYGEITFSWQASKLHGSVTIDIYDLVGRKVARCDAPASDGTARCVVHDLPAGTYIAQLQCGEHTTSTTVVIR